MTLIDGKMVASKIKQNIKEDILVLKKQKINPTLAVILVGKNPASATYVKMKEKSCEDVGMKSLIYQLDESVSEDELLELIDGLNEDDEVDGILVQLPLPKQINEDKIIQSIDESKDVDGFHAKNVGKMMQGLDSFVACTPLGVMKLLESYNIKIQGLNACVIGRSNIVGKPMASLLLNQGATVSICHSKTKDLSFYTKNADLIVVGVGKANLLKEDMVKKDVIIIDVGINRIDGKIVGDVDFENVKNQSSFITPVPGGVGPMTIAMLLSNTIKSAKRKKN